MSSRRFRHQQRQERPQQDPAQPAAPDPLIVVPDDLLEKAFQKMMHDMFPNVPVGSTPHMCIERAWYLGILFMQNINYTISLLPSDSALRCLEVAEAQCKAHFTKKRPHPNAGTTDNRADSEPHRTETDNSGEQDTRNQEQPGGEDASGTRDA